MLILGLTGSIGMGKSATAGLFAAEGVRVHDADRAVHRLYEGDAVVPIEAAFPGVTRDGRVDRERLARLVLGDGAAMQRLEAIVHPLVRRETQRFLDAALAAGARIVVFDIPLLFETKGEGRVDAIVVVSAPADMQRARVLARPGMTAEKFAAILARQVPDEEKRRRAHFVVDTSRGFDSARAQVRGILRAAAVIPGRVHTLRRDD
ncbi:MAG: dephospho-CoA kinase [Rhizobiales bacterium]|nr:dephospho-CoA kinase [Hyphomicrobiales bacterium]